MNSIVRAEYEPCQYIRTIFQTEGNINVKALKQSMADVLEQQGIQCNRKKCATGRLGWEERYNFGF